MNDSKKIETLNNRIHEMEQRLYTIHALSVAVIEYENSPEKTTEYTNVSENLSELIKIEAEAGIDVVSNNMIIT